jgi:23S rRNA pseudouridine1911/1915/1917 synthase
MVNFSVQPNEHVAFKVHHEDDDLVVVEKPARLVTQPGLGHESDTLLNGLFATWGTKLQNLGRERDFGLLHRLDRETSGLLLVALRARAYDAMRDAFANRAVRKLYWAIVAKAPEPASGVITLPIAEFEGTVGGRRGKAKKLARVSSAGKPAVTAYRVLDASHLGALLECRAVTGRLHQIRVHLEAIGSPILGDGLYAPRGVSDASPRLALHAHRLVFTHPVSGTKIDIEAAMPTDFKGVLKRLGLKRPAKTHERRESEAPEEPN